MINKKISDIRGCEEDNKQLILTICGLDKPYDNTLDWVCEDLGIKVIK